jgi:nitroreductase
MTPAHSAIYYAASPPAAWPVAQQPPLFIVLNDRAALEALGSAVPGTGAMLRRTSPSRSSPSKERRLDVGRVAQNMMAAAWPGRHHQLPQGVRDQTLSAGHSLPPDHGVGMCLAFGYPAPDLPRARAAPAFLDDFVRWGTW